MTESVEAGVEEEIVRENRSTETSGRSRKSEWIEARHRMSALDASHARPWTIGTSRRHRATYIILSE